MYLRGSCVAAVRACLEACTLLKLGGGEGGCFSDGQIGVGDLSQGTEAIVSLLELTLDLLVYADEALHLALDRFVLLCQNLRVAVQSHLLFLQSFLLVFKSLGCDRSSFVLVLDLSSFALSPLLLLLQLQEPGLKLPSFGNLQSSALLQRILLLPSPLHALLGLAELLE